MSDDQKEKISWWVELIWKVSVPLMAIGVFWLKATFATSADVQALKEEMSKRMTQTETAILLLTKDNEQNKRQDSELADHENRIRNLERPRARLKEIE